MRSGKDGKTSIMQTTLSHIQLNVQPANMAFYKDLMSFLGWQPIVESAEMLGVGTVQGSSLWFITGANDAANDYDGRGMNHIGIGAQSQADVDAAAAYLDERGVQALFETPRHRPEFTGSEDQTYYQVMFESPDRILFEVVYIGPKTV